MALTFSDLLGTPKKLEILLVEGKAALNVEYWPEFITEEFENQIQALSSGENAAASIADTLHKLLVSWDLDGVELCRAALAKVPSIVLSKILTSIMEDARPNSETAPTSAAG